MLHNKIELYQANMVQVLLYVPGAGAALEERMCPSLKGGSIQQALGGQDMSFVYYVELTDSVTVVAGLCPVLDRAMGPGNDDSSCTLRRDEATGEPEFTVYVALRDGIPIDATHELLAEARGIRTDYMYPDAEEIDATHELLAEARGIRTDYMYPDAEEKQT